MKITEAYKAINALERTRKRFPHAHIPYRGNWMCGECETNGREEPIYRFFWPAYDSERPHPHDTEYTNYVYLCDRCWKNFFVSP